MSDIILAAAVTFERMRLEQTPTPKPQKRHRAAALCGDTCVVPPRHSDEPPITFRCSRPPAHAGEHRAKGFGGRIVKKWPTVAPRETKD